MKIKNLFKTLLVGSALTFTLISGVTYLNNSTSEVTPTYAWSGTQTNNYSSSYYSTCEGKTGSELETALKNINKPKSTSYNWSRYEAADEAENASNYILCLYTRTNKAKSAHVGSYSWETWNREHIYPQGAFPASDTDNHNIFACEGQINNVRGSKSFGEVTHNSSNQVSVHGHTTDCYTTSSYFEPCDEAKGEVARAVMYTSIYYGFKINQIFQSVDLCLKWHEEHPVTNRDIYRNNTVYSLQGNRNPFVDHPEWANAIWGDDPVSVSLSMTSSMNLEVGKTANVNAKITGGTGTITYTSDDTSIATISSTGLVTAIKAGSTTVRASTTISGKTYTATCKVTVSEKIVVESVSLSGPTTVTGGEKGSKTFQVTSSVKYSSGTGNNKVTYSVSPTSVATISSSGLVTCLNNGTVTITATSQEDTTKKATLVVTISGLTEVTGKTVTMTTFTALNDSMDDVISYTTHQNGGTSVPQLNNGQIRLYQNGSGGGSIKIIAKSGYHLVQTVVGTDMSTTVGHKVDGGTVSSKSSLAAGAKYTVNTTNASTVEVICFGTSKSTRLYVNYLSVTYASNSAGEEESVTVTTLVTYLLAENKEGQCTTRFYEARDLYMSLSNEDQTTFKTSSDTQITNARNRYEAWGRHLNEDPYSYSPLQSRLFFLENDTTFIIIPISIILSIAFIAYLAVLKLLKKKNK
jgi:endonuclease I